MRTRTTWHAAGSPCAVRHIARKTARAAHACLLAGARPRHAIHCLRTTPRAARLPPPCTPLRAKEDADDAHADVAAKPRVRGNETCAAALRMRAATCAAQISRRSAARATGKRAQAPTHCTIAMAHASRALHYGAANRGKTRAYSMRITPPAACCCRRVPACTPPPHVSGMALP